MTWKMPPEELLRVVSALLGKGVQLWICLDPELLSEDQITDVAKNVFSGSMSVSRISHWSYTIVTPLISVELFLIYAHPNEMRIGLYICKILHCIARKYF